MWRRGQRSGSTGRMTGVWWAVVTAAVSGVAIWVNRFGVLAWGDTGGALPYTMAKNLVAALVLIVLLVGSSRDRATTSAVGRHWRGLTAVALIGGGIPFALFFEGLARASSTQAALIHKTLVLWVAAMAIPLLGEKVRGVHIGAIGLVFGGQVALYGGLSHVTLGSGELMILAATLLWSVEVIVAKRLLSDVRPLEIGVARMAGGALVLAMIGAFNGAFGLLGALGWQQIGWVLMTGGVLSIYVFTWLNALSLAPATDVTAVLVGSVVITTLLDAGPAGLVGAPAPGLALIAAGVALIVLTPLVARARA